MQALTRTVMIVVLLLLAAGAPAQAPDQKPDSKGPDLAAQIEAARRIEPAPLPAGPALARPAGAVNGVPLSLGEVVEEVVYLYGAPMIEVMARQRGLDLEAARRGIRVDPKAFEAAVREFLARKGKGRDLATALRDQRLSWNRFEAITRLNAAVASMYAADRGAEAAGDSNDRRRRAWAEKTLSRYRIQTDPARLSPGLYARIEGKWRLRRLLENHLAGRTPLTPGPGETDAALRFELAGPGGGRITARVDNLRVIERTKDGIQPATLGLTDVLPRWAAGGYMAKKKDPKDPSLVVVAPVEGGFPEFRLTDTAIAVTAEVRGRDLLAARLPDLKLRHLDDALRSRARYVAFQQAIKARGIRVSAERVAARIARERARYRGKDFSWEQVLQLVGRNVYLETRRFQVADGVDQIFGTEVSDDVLLAYYEAHIEHFGKATITASHILVSEVDPVTGRVDFQKAEEKIKEVYAKLKAGADFIEMVQLYSQDAVSAKRGGDVGLFTLVCAYDEEFCRLAFALQEGEITPPVRTSQGYHIIYCRKRTPPDRKEYPFLKIKHIVREDRQEDLRKRWLRANVYGKMKLENRIDEAWGKTGN